MARTLTKLAVAFIAFIAGLSAILLWSHFFLPQLSLCQLVVHNPHSYDNRNVKIKAVFYGYSNGVCHLNCPECGPESKAWATVYFEPSFSASPDVRRFLDSLQELTSRDEYKTGEVILTGRFEYLGRACFAPAGIVYAQELKQIGPVSKRPLNQ